MLSGFMPCLDMSMVDLQAERKIPMNYASRYRNQALSQQSYLPFKVLGGRLNPLPMDILAAWAAKPACSPTLTYGLT